MTELMDIPEAKAEDEAFFHQRYVTNITSPESEGQIAAVLENHGVAFFDGVHSREDFLKLKQTVGTFRKHDYTDADGITTFDTTISDEETANNKNKINVSYPLVPHTDGSAMPEPSDLLLFTCLEPDSEGGGKSTFVDGLQLYKTLQEKHPQLLEALSKPNAAEFGKDKRPGAVFETNSENGVTSIRFRYDAEANYNDEIKPQLPVLLDTIQSLQSEYTLKKGQGYIVNNLRMLHGRTEAHGNRRALRAHVDFDPNASLGQRVKRGFSTIFD